MAKRKGNINAEKVSIVSAIAVLVVTLLCGVLSGVIPLEDWVRGKPQTSAAVSVGTLDPYADVAVHFIDVGQGDCAYIKAYDKHILIDAGEKETTQTNVSAYLKSIGVTRLDYIIGSHPHSDHIGGLQEVIETFDVGAVIMPRVPDEYVPTTRAYENLLNAIADKGLKIKASQELGEVLLSEDGEAKLTFLGPVNDYSELNDMSVSVKFTAKGYSALFCGDVEKKSEKELIQSGKDFSANIFKLNHHGSNGSNTNDFLAVVSPDVFVVCVGEGNSYNHPGTEAMKRVTAFEKPVYRTDLNGTIVFEFEEDGMKCITER